MTYTVDVMADKMGFKSDIELVLSYTVCDIIYIGYDVISIVGAMTYNSMKSSREGVMSYIVPVSYMHWV